MDLAGKNVVVTGADGFIGSHLTEALVASGCDVTAFVYYNSFGSWGWLDTLPARVAGRRRGLLGRRARPERRARSAQGRATSCSTSPRSSASRLATTPRTATSTPTSTARSTCLQAARDLELERVVVTSTSEVYGTARYVPIDEKHPLQGQSPYSATKIGADKLAESFFRSFELPVRHRAAVQHVRAAAVRARGHPDDHHAAADRRRRDPARFARTRRATSRSSPTPARASSPWPSATRRWGAS